MGIIGVDAEAAFFVDVGVAHRYHNGVDGDVHHDHIENQKANPQVGNGDHVESAAANGKGLKETVKGTGAVIKGRHDWVADV